MLSLPIRLWVNACGKGLIFPPSPRTPDLPILPWQTLGAPGMIVRRIKAANCMLKGHLEDFANLKACPCEGGLWEKAGIW